MLLAEELVLLSLDPERGTAVNSSAEPMKPSVTGALIAELALTESVTLDGKRLVPSGNRPGDPLLLEALAALGEGKNAKKQLKAVDKALGGSRNRVVDRLADSGVVGRERGGLFGVTTHPVLQPAVRDEVVARLRAAAAGTDEIEPRTAVVLALSGPARLLEVVAPDKPRGHAKERIQRATDLTPIAPVVKKVIQEAQAATTAAVVAATSGAAVAGS